MAQQNIEQQLRVSRYIIIYKFVLGLFEFLLGLGIIFLGQKIVDLYQNFKSEELLEDPHDLLIKVIEKLIPFLAKHKGYIILFLLLLGVVKIVGAIGLMYRKHWGLDVLVVLTVVLLPFQAYGIVTAFSLAKLGFFIVNLSIALYLVEFQPKSYFINFKKRVRPNT